MSEYFAFLLPWASWCLECILVIPGAHYVIEYIQRSYQRDPANIVIEAILVFFSIKYLTSKSYAPNKHVLQFSEEDVTQLCEEWRPESLIPGTVPPMEKLNSEESPVVLGNAGLFIEVQGKGALLNVSATNSLGICNDEFVKKASMDTVDLYAVGTCGPRGFYGTLDLHLELETQIAQFLRTEDSIIYSQHAATVSSVIPSFAKVGDILVVDSGCNFAIQKGIELSRSIVFHFNHNDMQDLEAVLKDVQQRFAKKPLTRRFIICEGLYQNYGDICPLPRIVELKQRFKYRLIIDESLSIGSLGPRGAGVSDFFDIGIQQLDIIVGSMAHHFGGAGGFCAGSAVMVDHQRLNGKAYCFSASLPACLTTPPKFIIAYLQKNCRILMPKLQKNTKLLYEGLTKLSGFELESGPSPCMHLYLKKSRSRSIMDDAKLLDAISRYAMDRGIFITRAKYLDSQEWFPLRPSLRFNVSCAFTSEHMQLILSVLNEASSVFL